MFYLSGLDHIALASTVRRLFSRVTDSDAYHSALWLGCQRIGQTETEIDGEAHAIFSSTPSELAELNEAWIAAPAEISEVLNNRGLEGTHLAPEIFATIPAEAKAAALNAGALFRTDEARLLVAALKPMPEVIITALSAPLLDRGGSRLTQLWSAIEPPGKDLAFSAPYASAKKRVQTMMGHRGPKFTAAYSRYLLNEKAAVLPRSTSGDFEELREYRSGDDIRQIDWHAYARSDKFLVRKYREREYRPVKLLVDPEWLYEGFDETGESAPVLNELRVETLFTHLLLAEMEGVPIDLVILSRDGGHALTDLHGNGIIHKKEFHDCLSRLMSHLESVVREEGAVYQGGRRTGYNLFSSNPGFRKGELVVCAFAKSNLSTSQRALEALRRNGCFVHIVPGSNRLSESDLRRYLKAKHEREGMLKQKEQ